MAFKDLMDQTLKTVRNGLGEEVEYTPQSGDPLTIKGVFSEVFTQIDPASGVPVQTTLPNILIRIADLEGASPAKDDTISIGGTVYRVREVQPDGGGGALLLLHKV